MKLFPLLFLAVLISGCTSSQEDNSKYRIEKNLKNKFSDGPRIGTRGGGTDSAWINGVMVFALDSTGEEEELINADLRDLNGNHTPFDTCRSSRHAEKNAGKLWKGLVGNGMRS